MIHLLLKALWRTIVIFFIAVFLMLAVLVTTGNDGLATLAFPIGVYLGILAYTMDDEERNAWKRRY